MNLNELIELFRHWKEIEEYPAQAEVFLSGAPADYFYFILAGEVKLTLHGDSLGTETEGGIIGEMTMLENTFQSTAATTLTDAKLARFDRQQLQALCAESVGFSLHIMNVLTNRLRAVDDYITSHIEHHD